jgi:hypothetical protein
VKCLGERYLGLSIFAISSLFFLLVLLVYAKPHNTYKHETGGEFLLFLTEYISASIDFMARRKY